MPEKKNFGFLDFLVILVKWKKFFISLFIISMVLSYLAIYFFVDARYNASALLLPSGEENSTGFNGLLQNLTSIQGNLGQLTSSSDVDMYNSIINSRSVLEKVISKFDLIKVYKMDTTAVDYKEQTLKALRGNIDADLNDDGMTYHITVTAPKPELAADMTNFIIKLLNSKIIELKSKKSKDNRIYLGKRVDEVKDSLKFAENKMRKFQEKTGMFSAEDQTKALLEQLANLQATLASKQVELSVFKKLYGVNSAQVYNSRIAVNEFEKKLRNLSSGKDTLTALLSINELPERILRYFRLYRDIQIYTNILEFELPLFEQAKFAEQKDVPILQVIDTAIPPAKRSYPKRVITAFIISMGIFMLAFIFVYIRENENLMSNEKFTYVRHNILKWKSIKS